MTTTSGALTYANYGYEATFGTGVSGTRTFGREVKLTVTEKNSLTRAYGLGSRNATTAYAGKYEGSASIDFVMANGSFFRGILGAVADAGAGPYTHTHTEATTVPSLTITTGSELGATDEVTTITGAKINTWSITAAVGEPVKVRLECPFKTISINTSSISSQVAETEEPFTFAQGSVQLPSGTTIGLVQSFEMSGTNDNESIWGLGSRLLSAITEKKREYNFKMTVAFSDNATTGLYAKFHGDTSAPYTPSDPNTPAVQATLILTFSNGLSTTNLRSVVMTFANAYLDEHTLPKDVNEVIKEDVGGFALSCTSVIYTNNTAVDAGSP